jgi:hypothetical protein
MKARIRILVMTCGPWLDRGGKQRASRDEEPLFTGWCLNDDEPFQWVAPEEVREGVYDVEWSPRPQQMERRDTHGRTWPCQAIRTDRLYVTFNVGNDLPPAEDD